MNDWQSGSFSLYCPSCGKKVQDEEAVYCPYCAYSLRNVHPAKTSFPTAAGILAIFASCMNSFNGVVGLVDFANAYWYHTSLGGYPTGMIMPYWILFMAIFCFVAFGFGLAGGIVCLRRRRFELTVASLCFSVVSGLIVLSSFGVTYSNGWAGGILFGFPVLILSVLGIIFTVASKAEFS